MFSLKETVDKVTGRKVKDEKMSHLISSNFSSYRKMGKRKRQFLQLNLFEMSDYIEKH